MKLPMQAIQPADHGCDLTRVTATAEPVLVRDDASVRVAVYRAKDCSSPAWNDGALHAVVAEARESYRAFYGQHVPIFDRYDDKAWVYVAIASHESEGTRFDEALTLRFVPAAGLPSRNDDLNSYTCRAAPGVPLIELLGAASRGGPGQAHDPNHSHSYSQSRMGSIRPRARGGRQLSGNRHVGLAWCLMLDCFLADAEAARRSCGLLTAQTTEQLRVLGARVPMLPADEVLGLERGSICLDRQSPQVRELCYGVPTYFLDLGDLSSLLSRLLREGSLSPAAAARAVTPGVSLERALARPRATSFQNLHTLFAPGAPLLGSRLGGEELRELADAEVRDGPVLRLTLLDQLELELEQLRPRVQRPSGIVLRPRGAWR